MEDHEILIKPHYFVALGVFFIKAILFVVIIFFSFQVINLIVGHNILLESFETVKIAFENIGYLRNTLYVNMGLDFLEDRITDIVIVTVLLVFAQHSSILNRYWKLTDSELEYKEGLLSVRKTIVTLDAVMRVYAIQKADIKKLGDLYLELSTREKKLRLPFVFYTEDLVKEIHERVEKYKKSLIEEDVEKKVAGKKIEEVIVK